MYVSSIAPNTVQRNNEHKEERSDDKKREVKEDRGWKDGRCHLVSPRPPSVHCSIVGEKRRPSSRVPVGMVFSTVVGQGSACARGLLTFSGRARRRPRPPHLLLDRVVETGVGKPIVLSLIHI